MFDADAARIRHDNLRPPAVFPAPSARRVRWFPAAAVVAAAQPTTKGPPANMTPTPDRRPVLARRALLTLGVAALLPACTTAHASRSEGAASKSPTAEPEPITTPSASPPPSPLQSASPSPSASQWRPPTPPRAVPAACPTASGVQA